MSDIVRRTRIVEKIKRHTTEIYREMPFCLVQFPGLPGKAFEPVDVFTGYNSTRDDAVKDIHQTIEFDGRANLFMSEINGDGKPCQLHGFESWRWPAS